RRQIRIDIRLVDVHRSAEHDQAVVAANVRYGVRLAREVDVAHAKARPAQERIERPERLAGGLRNDEQVAHISTGVGPGARGVGLGAWGLGQIQMRNQQRQNDISDERLNTTAPALLATMPQAYALNKNQGPRVRRCEAYFLARAPGPEPHALGARPSAF